MRITVFIALIGFAASVPAYACIEVPPAIRTWVQCGYAVAHKTGDHRFMVSMAEAMVDQKKLKPTSQPRWREIQTRIEQRCGKFADAQRKDAGKQVASGYGPDDLFLAIVETSDRDKLVRS